MKISVNGNVLPIPPDVEDTIINTIGLITSGILDQIPAQYTVMAEAASRAMLYEFEKRMMKQGYMKEQIKLLRPEKGGSFCKKLIDIMLTNAVPALDNTVLHIVHDAEEIVDIHVNYNPPTKTEKI